MRKDHELAVNALSQSLVNHIKTLHKKSTTQPELVIAAAVDLCAACVSALHTPEGPVRDGLLNVVQETLKDRIAFYNGLDRKTGPARGFTSTGDPIH